MYRKAQARVFCETLRARRQCDQQCERCMGLGRCLSPPLNVCLYHPTQLTEAHHACAVHDLRESLPAYGLRHRLSAHHDCGLATRPLVCTPPPNPTPPRWPGAPLSSLRHPPPCSSSLTAAMQMVAAAMQPPCSSHAVARLLPPCSLHAHSMLTPCSLVILARHVLLRLRPTRLVRLRVRHRVRIRVRIRVAVGVRVRV